MGKILYFFLFLFGVSFTVQAQTAPQENSPQTSSERSEENAPAKEASKAEHSEIAEGTKDGIDLDKFFKKGEENAKNGASCNMPATPADPMA